MPLLEMEKCKRHAGVECVVLWKSSVVASGGDEGKKKNPRRVKRG
jgi:hypothetical protein